MKYFSNKVLDKKIKEEGGGGDYTAGEGIDISENEISIDSDTLDDIADGAEARSYFDSSGILSTSRDPFWQIGGTSGLVELKSAYSYVGAKKGIIFSVNQNEDANAHLEVVYKTMAGASDPIPVLHSKLPFYSDSFVSAGGLSSGGGGGGGGGATSLEGLDDVEYTGTPVAGQSLVYVVRDGVGLWTNATPTGGGTVTTVANVPPTSGGDIPKADLSAALGTGTVTQGNSQLVTGGTVYSAINSAISSVLKFEGVSSTPITDGGTQTPTIGGVQVTPYKGMVVLYGSKEFVWSGSAWEELGDEASWALKTITITGTGYLTGGGSLEANRTIDIAEAVKTKIEHGESAYNRTDWDQYLGIDANGHIYVKDNRGFYSSSFVSAGGVGSGGGGGGGGATELADLEDINFVTPITGGQVLMYRDLGGGDGEWYNADIEVGGVKTVANVVPTSGGNIPLADLASAFTTGGYKLTDHEYTNGTGLSLSSGTFSLTQAVQTSLGKADTAIQTVYDLVIKDSAGTTQLTYKPATSGTYSITLTKAMVGLGDVENTKLSTWSGSGNITTVGTISSGTWQGTAIGYNYVAAHYIGGTRTASAAGQATLLGIDAISNAQSSGSSDLSRIVWDATNNAWHFLGNLYADGFVSAGGMSDSGGGGGASNLYDLLDMSSTISDKPSGTGQKIIVFNPNGTDKQNRSGAWEYANMPSGSVTSVAGVSPVNGDIPVASLQTAIGLGDYLPKAGGTISSGSIYSLYLNNSASGATYVGQRFQIGGTTYGALFVGTDGILYYGPNDGAGQTVYHSGNASSMTAGASNLLKRVGGSFTSAVSGGVSINNQIAPTTGIFPYDNYTNAVLNIDRYNDGSTNYITQLGFSTNGMYMRIFNGAAPDTTTAWVTFYHSGNFVAGTNYVAPQTTLAGYGITDWLVASTSTALSSLTTSGSYRVNTQSDIPGSYSYGNLLVLRGSAASDTLAQIYFPYNTDRIYWRRGTTSNFTSNAWQELYSTANLTQSVVLDLIGSGTITNAMLAGSISDSKLSSKYMIIRNGQDIDFNMADNAYRSSVWYVHTSYTQLNKPGAYGIVADFNYDAGHLQIASDYTNKYYIRGCWWTAGGGTWDSWRTIYHSGNFNPANYLPLAGGTMTGADSITFTGDYTTVPIIRNYTSNITSGWARGLVSLQVDGAQKFSIGAYGSYTAGGSSNGITYAYIGCNSYDGVNIRFTSSTLTWGTNNILHAGNCTSYTSGSVVGSYTSNGGQQNPNYFGKNRVGFLMMNTTVNSNSQYKDWIIMDCYSGNDVGGGVAFGVNRQSLGAYIMRSDAARTSWAASAELYGTHNANKSDVDWTAQTLTANYAHLGNGSSVTSLELFGNANGSAIGFYKSGTRTALLYSSGASPFIRYNSDWSAGYTMYDSSNANKSDVSWTCSFLSAHVNSSSQVLLETGQRSGASEGGGIAFWKTSYHFGEINASVLALNPRSGGNVGIGTASPSYRLDIYSGSVGDAVRLTSTTTYSCIIYMPSGSGKNWSVGANNSGQFYFYSNSASRAYFTQAGALVTTGDQTISSDINLKTNLAPVTYTIEDIAKTRAVTFDWKDGRGHSAGSIAQDWKPLIPELVHGEEGNMTLAYGQIALVNTILLARKSESHEERIKELEARVAELEMENERLRMN